MQIQPHVTSLSLSRKLKEIGILQRSLFSHWSVNKNYLGINSSDTFSVGEYDERTSAFILTELMAMKIPSDKTNIDLLALDLIYALQNGLVKLSDINIKIANS